MNLVAHLTCNPPVVFLDHTPAQKFPSSKVAPHSSTPGSFALPFVITFPSISYERASFVATVHNAICKASVFLLLQTKCAVFAEHGAHPHKLFAVLAQVKLCFRTGYCRPPDCAGAIVLMGTQVQDCPSC